MLLSKIGVAFILVACPDWMPLLSWKQHETQFLKLHILRISLDGRLTTRIL